MTTIDDLIGYEGTLTVNPTGHPRIRLTANDWQLYTSSMNCDDAAVALNLAAQAALREPTREKAYDVYCATASEYAAYGTCDTEPRGVFHNILDHYWNAR